MYSTLHVAGEEEADAVARRAAVAAPASAAPAAGAAQGHMPLSTAGPAETEKKNL